MKAKERVFNNVTEQRRKTMSKSEERIQQLKLHCKRLYGQKDIVIERIIKLLGSPDICLTKYRIAIFCDSEFFSRKRLGKY